MNLYERTMARIWPISVLLSFQVQDWETRVFSYCLHFLKFDKRIVSLCLIYYEMIRIKSRRLVSLDLLKCQNIFRLVATDGLENATGFFPNFANFVK